jgi:hypothetical protein
VLVLAQSYDKNNAIVKHWIAFSMTDQGDLYLLLYAVVTLTNTSRTPPLNRHYMHHTQWRSYAHCKDSVLWHSAYRHRETQRPNRSCLSPFRLRLHSIGIAMAIARLQQTAIEHFKEQSGQLVVYTSVGLALHVMTRPRVSQASRVDTWSAS